MIDSEKVGDTLEQNQQGEQSQSSDNDSTDSEKEHDITNGTSSMLTGQAAKQWNEEHPWLKEQFRKQRRIFQHGRGWDEANRFQNQEDVVKNMDNPALQSAQRRAVLSNQTVHNQLNYLTNEAVDLKTKRDKLDPKEQQSVRNQQKLQELALKGNNETPVPQQMFPHFANDNSTRTLGSESKTHIVMKLKGKIEQEQKDLQQLYRKIMFDDISESQIKQQIGLSVQLVKNYIKSLYTLGFSNPVKSLVGNLIQTFGNIIKSGWQEYQQLGKPKLKLFVDLLTENVFVIQNWLKGTQVGTFQNETSGLQSKVSYHKRHEMHADDQKLSNKFYANRIETKMLLAHLKDIIYNQYSQNQQLWSQSQYQLNILNTIRKLSARINDVALLEELELYVQHYSQILNGTLQEKKAVSEALQSVEQKISGLKIAQPVPVKPPLDFVFRKRWDIYNAAGDEDDQTRVISADSKHMEIEDAKSPEGDFKGADTNALQNFINDPTHASMSEFKK